jgi:2-phospho-L-lactate guanylyltransferase
MNLWLLVPVKPFDEGKSRLAGVLPADARAALSQAMLARVLDRAQASGVLAGVLVVSRDPHVLTYARKAGVNIVHETGHDLNEALTEASEQAVKLGAEAVLVLPADLPLLTTEDVRQLTALGQAATGIVITRSPDGGTNALLLRPPGVIEFAFGPGSFERHRQAAQLAGAACQVFASPTLALDVDWPEDLQSSGTQG